VARADLAGEVAEVVELHVAHVADLVDDADHRRREFLGAVGTAHQLRNVGTHAAELLEEVDVEIGSAELTVGDADQAEVLLEADDLGDRAILDRAQRRSRPAPSARAPRSGRTDAGSCRRGRRETEVFSEEPLRSRAPLTSSFEIHDLPPHGDSRPNVRRVCSAVAS
jgi:hypothetical protein